MPSKLCKNKSIQIHSKSLTIIRRGFIKHLSTTALAKHLQLEPRALFAKLVEVNYMVRESDKWVLTAKGKLAGGRIKTSEKLGNYIEWPGDLTLDKLPKHLAPDVPIAQISSTKIGKKFEVSAHKINYIFKELGWLNAALKGWKVTEQGVLQGGIQHEDPRSGVPYVMWPETIIQSPFLLNSIHATLGKLTQAVATQYQALDGHSLNSEAEVLIDNWLYLAGLVHAHQRKLPIDSEVYANFYLPSAHVYIEYWRDDNDPKIRAHQDKKRAVYQKHHFKLIELHDTDMGNLDEVLLRQLLKFGIQAY